ncbi:hypothetical protein [Brevibacillus laterosporus]|uniref:Uncharacterized protein n=1 Tax=Brevibacillus laterosporus TaxID=1465 RepID=A0AAP8QAI6_BRELA|nr:hypothetical protein [Brevibacillus laterosporus]MED1663372.1 hypothetical protein [Brevibacillus laterosporus]MED1668642.1 hypothetical protein [Brevibacillus laterosporus]MED1717431.1 hypothetical protein [Brevibacillus laterosporus]PPA90029.1 hypothetical protein C4A76_00755 [Brevibacillus laterosporus]PPA93106.1 hypothetical protein C4A77_20250 [Brevibacillus laterosporus]
MSNSVVWKQERSFIDRAGMFYPLYYVSYVLDLLKGLLKKTAGKINAGMIVAHDSATCIISTIL